MLSDEKKFTIIAGPNGAGKTTSVESIFPNLLRNNLFINADVFAQSLSPEDVSKGAIAAGKKFLKEMDRLLQGKDSFMIETTLSGITLLNKIHEAKQKGFIVNLIFLWISSAELCDFRVKGRVALGGHNIPIEVIARRYKRGLAHFASYLEIVDECKVYLADQSPVLIYTKDKGEKGKIIQAELYDIFQSAIQKASN